jgi:hypothetical protein
MHGERLMGDGWEQEVTRRTNVGHAHANVIGFAEMPLKVHMIISELGIRVGCENSKAIIFFFFCASLFSFVDYSVGAVLGTALCILHSKAQIVLFWSN